MLHGLFEAAVRLECVRSNPVARTKPPKRSSDEVTQVRQHLSLQEAQEYLKALPGTPLEAFVLLCVYLGLRRGETLGLKWDDIDFDAGTLKIRRTLREGTRLLPDGSGLTRPVCNDPKTKSSRRELEIGQACVAALRRQQTRQRHSGLRRDPRGKKQDSSSRIRWAVPLPVEHVPHVRPLHSTLRSSLREDPRPATHGRGPHARERGPT